MTEEIKRGRAEPNGPIDLPAGALDFGRIANQSTDWIEDAVRQLWAKYPPPDPPEALRKPVDWPAEIRRWQQIIDDMPPRRTEPIKLTPDQWALLPHGDPRIPTYGGRIDDLLGIPVVMVQDESESTPVAEGWIKPKRRWWRRLWPWRRS